MENRSFGLDVLRSVGIWMVMITHVAYWFGPRHGGAYYTFITPLLLGVESFFTLRGLLAAISFLLPLEKRYESVRSSGAVSDIRHRWGRNLPNYFLFISSCYAAFKFVKPEHLFGGSPKSKISSHKTTDSKNRISACSMCSNSEP
jgi:peptidoglycan/LPS O-acetylase OafA/YrhL